MEVLMQRLQGFFAPPMLGSPGIFPAIALDKAGQPAQLMNQLKFVVRAIVHADHLVCGII